LNLVVLRFRALAIKRVGEYAQVVRNMTIFASFFESRTGPSDITKRFMGNTEQVFKAFNDMTQAGIEPGPKAGEAIKKWLGDNGRALDEADQKARTEK
jgi:hypothetical protein